MAEEMEFSVSGPEQGSEADLISMPTESRNATDNAAAALKVWQEQGSTGKPYGADKETSGDDDATRQEDLKSQDKKKDKSGEEKPETNPKKEKEEPKSDDEETEESDTEESDTEENPDASEPEGQDGETEEEDESEQGEGTDEIRALLDRIETLERETRESKTREQVEAEAKEISDLREKTKDPFTVNVPLEKLIDSLPEEVKGIVDDDPLTFQANLAVMNALFNETLKNLGEYEGMQNRISEYDKQQEQLKQQQVLADLKSRDVDIEVFGTEEFISFESDPKNSKTLKALEDRYGFGTAEYAQKLYDEFQDQTKKTKQTKAKKVKEKAKETKAKVAEAQAQDDKTRVPTKSSPEPQTPVPEGVTGILENWRSKRKK